MDPAVPGGRSRIVHSCASLDDPRTRKREFRALEEAMAETGVSESVIVTLADRETIEVEAGTVRLVHVWEWVLAPDSDAAGDA